MLGSMRVLTTGAQGSWGNNLLEKILGNEIVDKIGDTVGMSVKSIYERARELDFSMPYKKFQKIYDDIAFCVYAQAIITPNVEKLAEFLVAQNIKIGIVSSSNIGWINQVLSRLTFRDDITEILSLNSRNDIQHKPYPDGYNEMMHILHASPAQTIILEDSNKGIRAAKASGAFTIAYTQNLIPGYKQISADAKANTMNEVIKITKNHFLTA